MELSADDNICATAITCRVISSPPRLKASHSGSVRIPPPSSEAATRETKDAKTDTVAPPDRAHKPSRSGSPHLKKNKAQAENSRAGQKLSPERMQIVIDALRKFPTLESAAAKAGIHRKALTYRLKRSEGGHDGYELEHQGVQARFHEYCKWAIDEAHELLLSRVREAMCVEFDANGNLIDDVNCQPNKKLMEIYLEWMRPERYGKITRTRPVLVADQHNRVREPSFTASIKARKWKSLSKKVQELTT